MSWCHHFAPTAALIAAITIASTAAAGTVYVPGGQPTIQAGIDACSDGDEVVVADGIYTGPGNRDIVIGEILITVRSASGNPAMCIIDCQSNGRGFIVVYAQTAQATIEGFTIRNGLVMENGGAIYTVDSSPTFRNCVIENSFAELDGGGAYVLQGSPSFIDCAFEGNTAFRDGGGLHNVEGSLTITGCSFDGNDAFSFGGAFSSASDLEVSVSQTSFSSNTALTAGGAVYHTRGTEIGGTMTIDECTFTGNSIPPTVGGYGGAIHVVWTSLEVLGGTFTVNDASEAGGAISASAAADLTVTGTQFSGNSAIYGGGIWGSQSTLTLTECTFDMNTAVLSGGGLCNSDGNAELTECDFSLNWTSVYDHNLEDGGGAIASFSNATLTVTGGSFNGNETPAVGGGIKSVLGTLLRVNGSTFADNQSTFMIVGCTFLDNGADEDGGALDIGGDVTDVLNCVFADNNAGRGGAVALSMTQPTFTNCTFTGNTAQGAGGAVLLSNATVTLRDCTMVASVAGYGNSGAIDGGIPSGAAQVINSILWNNTPQSFAQSLAHDVYYSDVEGWTGPGPGNIDAEPLFVDADGPDDVPGNEDDDLRLSGFSPCIDAGDNTEVGADAADLDGDSDTSEPVPYDLDGLPRFVDRWQTPDTGVPDGVNPLVDMGAHEFQPTCSTDLNGDGQVDVVDFLGLLAGWDGIGGDVNIDGTTTVVDFLELIGTWGPCP
jgi:predicted outer membrane repeat protein